MPFSEDYFHLFENVPAFHDRVTQKYLPASSGAQISERLLRCIWYDKLYDQQKLATRDGRKVIVHSPGTWNLESGPDFVRAEVSIGTARLKGDIELHINPAGWRLHKHSLDKRYDRVILHVTLTSSAKPESPMTSHGVAIPEAALWKCLTDDLKVLKCALCPEEYPYKSLRNFGRCHGLLEQSPREVALRLLSAAGDARIIAKQRRFSYEAEKENLDQVAYAALLEGMGYKAYREQFGQLARKLPYGQLRERILSTDVGGPAEQVFVTQALLMGAAGFLGDAKRADSLDSREYVTSMRRQWRSHGFKDLKGSDIAWESWAVRPANNPQRRIAGVSHILARSYEEGVFKWVLESIRDADTQNTRGLVRSMTSADDGFWSYRYIAGGKRLPKPVRLIGTDRAIAVIVNTFIPLALLDARLNDDPEREDLTHKFYRELQSPQSNSVTRLTEYRMFGDSLQLGKMNSARIQQGLHQIFADWCSEDPTCENCGVFSILQSGRISERLQT